MPSNRDSRARRGAGMADSACTTLLARLRAAEQQVKQVPLPTRDPFTGKEGALTDIWTPIADHF